MKKFLSTILSFVMLFCTVSVNPIYALNDVNTDNSYIEELKTDTPYLKKWLIIEGNKEFELTINYKEHYLIIDNELVPYTVEEIQLPSTRTTVDYSTGRNFKSKIPWNGSVTLLAAAIGGILGGGAGAGWASTIAGALTADAENIWLTFTQYDSKETYYSSYSGTYYKKCINKNITFYENSVSKSNIIYGPKDGS